MKYRQLEWDEWTRYFKNDREKFTSSLPFNIKIIVNGPEKEGEPWTFEYQHHDIYLGMYTILHEGEAKSEQEAKQKCQDFVAELVERFFGDGSDER